MPKKILSSVDRDWKQSGRKKFLCSGREFESRTVKAKQHQALSVGNEFSFQFSYKMKNFNAVQSSKHAYSH